jgi:hypothetical protein
LWWRVKAANNYLTSVVVWIVHFTLNIIFGTLINDSVSIIAILFAQSAVAHDDHQQTKAAARQMPIVIANK